MNFGDHLSFIYTPFPLRHLPHAEHVVGSGPHAYLPELFAFPFLEAGLAFVLWRERGINLII